MEALERWGRREWGCALVAVAAAGGLLVVPRLLRARRRRRRQRIVEDWYDLVIKLDDFMSVCHKGWMIDDRRVDVEQWHGTIVSVLGEFNRGKTWVLNRLAGTHLPCGVNIRTEGLSFKRLTLAKKEIALLDTAGSGAPVRSVTTGQLQQKKATEKFLRDVVFECADVFLYIVNDISAEEQIQLHSLSLSLEQSGSGDRRILVIHNLRERTTAQEMRDACAKIVEMYTSTRCYAFAPEDVMDDASGTQVTIDVLSGMKEHRIAKYQMHLFIGQEGTPAGEKNNAVFTKVRQILNTASARGDYHILQKVLSSVTSNLPKYIEGPPMQLCLLPDDHTQHPTTYVTVVPEERYLSLETRGLLKRAIRICKQDRSSELKTKQLQSYLPRLLAKCPELTDACASLLGWADGRFTRIPSWDAAGAFLERHLADLPPLDGDPTDALPPTSDSGPDSQSRWWGKDDVGTMDSKDWHRQFADELEVGLYRLKPQPLPYFLSAEQTDGNTPPFTVAETAAALCFAIELPGVLEPHLTFRPLLAGGGFMFTITAWKAHPLPSSDVLRTHSDGRVMGSPTRPLQFQFVVPSIFELPLPDAGGHLPPVGEFRNGVLTVSFRTLPTVEQTVIVTTDTPTPRLRPRTSPPTDATEKSDSLGLFTD